MSTTDTFHRILGDEDLFYIAGELVSWPVWDRLHQERNLAWAAGLFEGEGWLSSSIDTRRAGEARKYSAGLTTTDHDIAVRFGAIVGWKVYGPYERKLRPHHKTTWRVESCSLPVITETMRRLWPFLGQRRASKVAEVLGVAA
jgi:hypothetical protein